MEDAAGTAAFNVSVANSVLVMMSVADKNWKTWNLDFRKGHLEDLNLIYIHMSTLMEHVLCRL